MRKLSIDQQLTENIFIWVKVDRFVISEIQRPYVWDSFKVQDLKNNLRMNYVPEEIMDIELRGYQKFLVIINRLWL